MSNKITHKQKIFADAYMETGNKTQSALKAYDTKDYGTAGIIGHENLKKPNVIEYLEGKQPKYISKMESLSESAESEGVQFQATKDLLDRSGLKPIEKSVSLNVNVETNMTDKERKIIEEFDEKLKKESLE